jgi:hypothetical protein
VQSSAEFIARKNVSYANNRCLEYLITLQRSLVNILKSRGPETDPRGTPKRTSKGNERVSKIPTEDADWYGTYETSSRNFQRAHAQMFVA